MTIETRTPNDLVLLVKEARWLLGRLLAGEEAAKADAEAWLLETEDDVAEGSVSAEHEDAFCVPLWRLAERFNNAKAN